MEQQISDDKATSINVFNLRKYKYDIETLEFNIDKLRQV